VLRERLATAVEAGDLSGLAGRSLLAVGIPSIASVAPLSPDILRVVQPFRPCHDRLISEGAHVTPALGSEMPPTASGLVALPRARARAWAWIADAAAQVGTGGYLIVDGAKTDGIDTIHRALRTRLDAYDSLPKAHGRLLWGRVRAGDDLSDQRPAPTAADGFITAPGVFSASTVDPGSRALADALPTSLGDAIADLGAGWGYLSARLLERSAVEILHLVEADYPALQAARANVADPRARFHWADALDWAPDAHVDTVVMNPPFHEGRAADPALGRAFIRAAAAMLKPKGSLWMVANRHLPYETDLDSAFAEWHALSGGGAFKIIHARAPRRTWKGRSR